MFLAPDLAGLVLLLTHRDTGQYEERETWAEIHEQLSFCNIDRIQERFTWLVDEEASVKEVFVWREESRFCLTPLKTPTQYSPTAFSICLCGTSTKRLSVSALLHLMRNFTTFNWSLLLHWRDTQTPGTWVYYGVYLQMSRYSAASNVEIRSESLHFQ